MFRFFLIALAAISVSACSGSTFHLPETTSADIANAQKKIEASKQPLKTYERSDKEYQAKLASITKRLTQNIRPLCVHTGYTSCRFDVMYNAEDAVNAYADGNSDITLYRGILQHLQTDDEIAAVIAHEMGHHLANHITKGIDNAAAGAAAAGILVSLTSGMASIDTPHYNTHSRQNQEKSFDDMLNIGAELGSISYSKEQEREADLLAVYLLERAGYNLERAQNIMVAIINISNNDLSARSALFDTHPVTIERIAMWEKATKEVRSNKSKLPYKKEGK